MTCAEDETFRAKLEEAKRQLERELAHLDATLAGVRRKREEIKRARDVLIRQLMDVDL